MVNVDSSILIHETEKILEENKAMLEEISRCVALVELIGTKTGVI